MRKIRVEAEVQSKDEFWEAVAGATVQVQKNEKKDKIPVLTPPDKIKKLVDEVVNWKGKEKEAKAQKETAEVDVIDWAKGKQEADAFANNFQKSYRIQGVKEVVTYVSSDKFSRIDPSDIPSLKDILGRKFDEFVQKNVTVKLLDEVLSSEVLQKELMELLGNKFAKFFKAETTFVPVEDFDRKIYSFSKKAVEQIKDIIKQAKPSLR